jgi:hypothetical protein
VPITCIQITALDGAERGGGNALHSYLVGTRFESRPDTRFPDNFRCLSKSSLSGPIAGQYGDQAMIASFKITSR